MNYLSVCSGIEAATVAWRPLGWQAVGFSEIEPFPCSLLAHYYPKVPNYGDMTKYREWEINEPIDLVCGGTPCQSFSVAGLRKGLDDPRGNLALVFLGVVDRFKPRWVVWENVPGVLSSWSDEEAYPTSAQSAAAIRKAGLDPGDFIEVDQTADFDCFTNALQELGYGVCARSFDAQYFNVPQRRERVFVVGYFGDWRPSAAVLFERASLQRDTTPRRTPRQGTAPTIAARTRGGGGLGTDAECDGAVIPELAGTIHAEGHCKTHVNIGSIETGLVAGAVSAKWAKGTGGPSGDECQNLIAFNWQDNQAFQTSTKTTNPLRANQTEAIAQQVQWASGGGEVLNDAAQSLRSGEEHSYQFVAEPVAFTAEQEPKFGTIGQTLGTYNGRKQCVANMMRVRRLTPRECERLMGLPDDYTLIQHKGKPASDSARYKAIGNSWAVPCARWIGERIQMFEGLKIKQPC